MMPHYIPHYITSWHVRSSVILCLICHNMLWHYAMRSHRESCCGSTGVPSHHHNVRRVPQVKKWTKSHRRPLETAIPPQINLHQKPHQIPPAPPPSGSQRGRWPPATHSLSQSTNHTPPPLCSGCWFTQPSPCLMVRWKWLLIPIKSGYEFIIWGILHSSLA